MLLGMRSRSTIILLAVVFCVVDAWAQEATWTTHGLPRGANVSAYATASASIDYCIAGQRLYRRIDRGPWQAWADTSLLNARSQVSAWADTVVVLSIGGPNRSRLHYSNDAGATWTSTEVPYTTVAILPHTSAYVALSEASTERGIVRCVDYRSGVTTSITADASPAKTGSLNLYAADGHVLLSSGYTDSTRAWREIYHLHAIGTDASSWAVQRDSAQDGPYMIIGGGIAALDGRRLRHFHRRAVDTIILPEAHGFPGQQRDGLLHHNGAWLVRMSSGSTHTLATSSEGFNWSPYEHSISSTVLKSAVLWAWTGTRIVAETGYNGLWEYSATANTMSAITEGLSHRGQVESDGRFIVACTSTPEGESVTVHVLDDSASPPAISEYIVHVAEMKFLRVTNGIAWIVGDSLHALDLRKGNVLYVLPPASRPSTPRGLSTTSNEQLIATKAEVFRRRLDETEWRSILSFSSFDELSILDVCIRPDGFYVLTRETIDIAFMYAVRIAKYAMSQRTLIAPIVIDTTTVHWWEDRWYFEDLGSSVAINERDRAVSVVSDDGSAFRVTHLDRPFVAKAGQLWERVGTEIVAADLTDHDARRHVVPPFPARRLADWFCGPNRCYVNDIFGLHSVEFDTVTTSVPEQQITSSFRIDVHGSVHTSIEGKLTIADIQGRTVVTQHVTPGTFPLPAMARGVYAAVLVGIDGAPHYSMFCSPGLQAR